MRISRNDLTQSELKELLDYDPLSGVFRWKDRDRRHFKADCDWKKWNTRYAGTVAGRRGPRAYRQIMIRPHLYYAHRLAWLYVHGVWPDPEVDHINGVGSDNRIANLRQATRVQNLANSRGHRDGLCGRKGVKYDKRRDAFIARIFRNGREVYLGSFPSLDTAAQAYEVAAQEMDGGYARGTAHG